MGLRGVTRSLAQNVHLHLAATKVSFFVEPHDGKEYVAQHGGKINSFLVEKDARNGFKKFCLCNEVAFGRCGELVGESITSNRSFAAINNTKAILFQLNDVALQHQKQKAMQIDHQQMLRLIKQNVLEVEPTAQVWLYGSRANGTAREDSDWDVLVLSQKDRLTTTEEAHFMDHICDLMVNTGQAIQLFAYGLKDWHTRHRITPFYQNIQSEAIQL